MARKLEGQDRGLDALVGLVVMVAVLAIGYYSVIALYELGTAAPGSSGASEATNTGFILALIGSTVILAIATVIYLVRLATGRRSWTVPFWAGIFMTVVLGVGYFVMVNG